MILQKLNKLYKISLPENGSFEKYFFVYRFDVDDLYMKFLASQNREVWVAGSIGCEIIWTGN